MSHIVPVLCLIAVVFFLEMKLGKEVQRMDKEFQELKNSIKENRNRILANKEKLDKIKDNG